MYALMEVAHKALQTLREKARDFLEEVIFECALRVA